ncbi:hypothetical protein F511_17906 [Dorcoceras hygrometricum]|uniref:Uncharacterized protein n=1 Tax=Dorcoceras hygrometricum TaxID=472368 RepID=A0A2Z7AKH4_9LAMI|nr:hypothetical protein F511_17906 [Dorcoceras hygrometricum]
MTSAFLLLRRAGISNDDVSNISRQLSGISDDDVSSDVITISRWIKRSAKEKLLTDEKNKGKVELLSAVSYNISSRKLQYIQSCWKLMYQLLEVNESAVANEDEPAVARSVVTKKRQQLSEQLLNKLLEYIQLLERNKRSKWKESMAEIESCKCLKSRGQDLNRESATMTSAFLLLRRAGISNDDVSNISRQLSGISDDDVSSDVIKISRWIKRSAKEKLLTDEKNKGKVELLSAVSYSISSRKLQYIQSNDDVSNISRQLSGISDDDVSSDVIKISRWIKRSAKEKLLTDEKNKGKVELLSAVSYSISSRKLQYIQSCWKLMYQLLEVNESAVANEDEPAVARSVVTKKRQQLSEQLLNKLLEYIQLLERNKRSKWKESMAEIESCKCLKSRGQDLYYSGKFYNIQRMVAHNLGRRQIGRNKRGMDLKFI